MSVERHCDPITMDHIIELRKQLRETERQRDNVLDYSKMIYDEVCKLRMKIIELGGSYDDDDRNC